jgi:hypothetical protein
MKLVNENGFEYLLVSLNEKIYLNSWVTISNSSQLNVIEDYSYFFLIRFNNF